MLSESRAGRASLMAPDRSPAPPHSDSWAG
jgi:hypothetical protein